MKTLKDQINEALKIGNKNLSGWSTYTCQPKTRAELKKIVEDRIVKVGPNCDLNDIDTSIIEDMSYLFAYSIFNGDISKWNTSKVKNMYSMFRGSDFNGDISSWDTSNVIDMTGMFMDSKFNQDISKWNINKDCDTTGMFNRCSIKDEYKPVI